MKLLKSSRCLPLVCSALALGLAGSCSSQAANVPSRPAGPPATVAEAAKVLDLAGFPLMDGAEKPADAWWRASKKAPADAKAAFEFQRQQFASRNWQELPGSYASDQSCSGTFAKDGFAVAVMTYPTGVPGQVSISIDNFGNVPLDKLPVPTDAKPLVASPATAMFVTDAPVAETVETSQAARRQGMAAIWHGGRFSDLQAERHHVERPHRFRSGARRQDGDHV